MAVYLPPVSPTVITSGIGYRCTSLGCEDHKGLDIKCTKDQAIGAARDGSVVYAGWSDRGLGYLVAIQHEDGDVSYYGHNSQVYVAVGSYVRAGERIAKCGSSGRSTGLHSHFEVRDKNGQTVKPAL